MGEKYAVTVTLHHGTSVSKMPSTIAIVPRGENEAAPVSVETITAALAEMAKAPIESQ